MTKINLFLALTLSLNLFGCADDDPTLELSEYKATITNVTDVDNVCNPSDVQFYLEAPDAARL